MLELMLEKYFHARTLSAPLWQKSGPAFPSWYTCRSAEHSDPTGSLVAGANTCLATGVPSGGPLVALGLTEGLGDGLSVALGLLKVDGDELD